MLFNVNSKIRDILNHEQAKAILEKHLPGASTHPQLHMALDMSLKEASWYPESGLTQAKLKAMVEELEQI